ncbi:TIGR03745 family integrating conjugative element membrane protein [Aggregatibacter actinomycetemcomitans]|uniref:TIGR03745 family integrating conjugative element membrane protein n=1 Tax=Aggregatibacter actinomycetemcomitans TaxID=714 RepID=UPI00024003FB|nr:TIGR03745 family integrating conjugative element membrane protein [Aggregatibacter actinomycetemcomitans]EHK90245.1 integrating conjugative element membrane protein [Aggregatibacter actinomycetemcomitans RhAA1]KNE77313.1 membrane protein [Aggregatibacter actinomycetemcomitans RhAA1]MBN6079266.1 TIGR03745 family integrating conjugative element membrane protein [Aggregatibacter actinomycetemcomitans]
MKLLEKTSALYQRTQQALLGLVISLVGAPALAELPKLEDPSRGKGNGMFETIKNYFYDGLVLLGLLAGAVVIFVVIGAIIGGYKDVTSGKKSWSEFALYAIAGIVLIVVVVWLATKAKDIL